jgi:hypothetical protein
MQHHCFQKEHNMTSIALQHINAPRSNGDITTAFHELVLASRNLITALWTSLIQDKVSRTLTIHEEAEKLREMAYRLSASDPHFAQDLYAAAERHECSANTAK